MWSTSVASSAQRRRRRQSTPAASVAVTVEDVGWTLRPPVTRRARPPGRLLPSHSRQLKRVAFSPPTAAVGQLTDLHPALPRSVTLISVIPRDHRDRRWWFLMARDSCATAGNRDIFCDYAGQSGARSGSTPPSRVRLSEFRALRSEFGRPSGSSESSTESAAPIALASEPCAVWCATQGAVKSSHGSALVPRQPTGQGSDDLYAVRRVGVPHCIKRDERHAGDRRDSEGAGDDGDWRPPLVPHVLPPFAGPLETRRVRSSS